MEKTGISFDIDPLTFTLEGVFAMQLHQYTEVISLIVASAQRELVIEQVGIVEFTKFGKLVD